MNVSMQKRGENNRGTGSESTGGKTNPQLPVNIELRAPAMTKTNEQETTDEQLLESHRHGDGASFEKLVHLYERELFHFLVRFLGDRAAADDMFQETFLQVYQSADTFDSTRRFRPWLFTIAANKARDLIRSQGRRPTNPLQASNQPRG